MVLLQFEPADGRVCRLSLAGELYARAFWCACVHTSIPYTRLLGPKCIFVVLIFSLVVLHHCDECVPWIYSLFAIL